MKTDIKKTKPRPYAHVPGCDGDTCQADAGPLRVLPVNAEAHHGNLILCEVCHGHEIAFRRWRNENLDQDAQFALPAWEDLQVYNQGEEVTP